jgi:hypothetical protein
LLTSLHQLSTRSEPARTSRRPPSRACSTSRQVCALSHHTPHRQNRGLTPQQGKAKYNAWQKVVDEALTPEQAQEKYVAKIEEMKAAYGYDENKQPEAVGGQ